MRKPWLLIALSALLGACATFVDGPRRVEVNGTTYDLIVLSEGDLKPVAEGDLTLAGDVDAPEALDHWFGDLKAYALDGVDPRGFLLTPRVPGLTDDPEPYADYFGLIGPGDRVPAVCAYFAAGRFTECDP